MRPRIPLVLVLVAVGATLCGCGAGVIVAAVLGSKGTSPGGGQTESSITLSQPRGPLSIEVDEFYVRRAVLRGARLPTDADAELRLVADVGGQAVADVQTLLLIERSGDETTLTFALRTETIAGAVGDVRAQDVDAALDVLAVRDSGVEVLFRAPFLLLRQPTLTLVPNDPTRGISLVSVLGGELELSATALPTSDARDVVVEIVTGDPNPPAGSGPAILLRRATNIRTEPDPLDPTRTTVLCTLPSSTFSTEAFVRLTHATAGRSTVVAGVVYRPELSAVVAPRGTADGGDFVSLNGVGLVPLDFSTRPARPDFGSLRVVVRKEGREVVVPAADLRPSLSSQNNVVFVTPPSPDGRAGPATVLLRVSVPTAIEVERADLFAYAANQPDFGPRGFALDGVPAVAAAFGARRADAGPDDPLDAAVVGPDASGVPVVRVFEARGNGTFSRLGLPIVAGDRADPDQRAPIDLVWGEFQGDAWRDVLVIDGGTTRAAHTVLRGRDDPSTPLRLSGVAFRTNRLPVRAHVGALDDDPRDDVLVVGRVDAQRTTEYATSSASGTFTARPVFAQPVPLVETSTVADVDGDGHDDMVFANAGAGARLRIAYGELGPLFGDQRAFDLSAIPELASAELIGVHAGGPGPERTIVLVARDPNAVVAPALVMLPPDGGRTYGGTHVTLPLAASGGPPVRSLAADLDSDGISEIVVARDPGGLALWSWQGGVYAELSGAVGLAPADTGTVLDLAFGRAVDASRGGADAVFVAHVAPLPGGPRPRVTTLLVASGPVLVDPVAAIPLPAPPRGIAIGAFTAATAPPQDVVVASMGRLDILANDGVGGFAPRDVIGVSGLVPETIVGVAPRDGAPADEAAFLLADGRVGVLRAGAIAPALSDTGLFDGAGTATAASRIAVGDVDGDGRSDLVVLLDVERPVPIEPERFLLLLRGVDPSSASFPFILPASSARTRLSANAIALALGDLAPDASGRRLEVVLAVPRDDPQRGLHFFRLEPGAAADDWALVPSVVDPADPHVAADADPRLVLAADLESDGLADLVVVSGSLDLAQVYRQTGLSTRAPGSGEVDPLVFARSASRVLPSGTPVAARLVDVDGDGVADFVVQVRLRADPSAHVIAVSVSDGLAGLSQEFEVPAPYLGSSGPDLAFAVGDVNGDGLPDLALAWSGDAGARPAELRVVFGGHL